MGEYGKLCAYETARPSMKRIRSVYSERTSFTSRVLPMPASPITETITPRPSRSPSIVRSSTVSSKSRPTSGPVGIARSVSRTPRTRKVVTGRLLPRMSCSLSSSSSKQPSAERAVSAAIATSPDGATSWSREATLTVSPSAFIRSAMSAPSSAGMTTGPVFTPTRTERSTSYASRTSSA